MSARAGLPFVGVIFDLDGTLTQPEAIDFDRIRERIGMPEPGSILHWIDDHAASRAEAESMRAVVWEEESLALDRMELGTGIERLVEALIAAGPCLSTAICTRNNGDAIVAFDERLRAAGYPGCDELFPVQVARDYHSDRLGRPVLNKPSPEPTHEIMHAWGLAESYAHVHAHEAEPPRYPDLLFVGDSEDDLLAGRRAGTAAAWMNHGLEPEPEFATLSFRTLADCARALRVR